MWPHEAVKVVSVAETEGSYDTPDQSTFHGGTEKGCTDYPALWQSEPGTPRCRANSRTGYVTSPE